MSKLIKAVFTGRFCRTQRVFQWDTDDKLQIVNVDLPTNYTVDFSNSKTGDSVPVLATSDTVQIPPNLFVPGSEIYAWIWLSDSNGGHTRCEATIPIDPRARRTGTEPTPAQASAWDEAVDTLNETIEGIPAVVDAALTEAKESGEFDGADGADGNGVWYVDVKYTRTTGAGAQAQLDHMVGRPGATPAAGDLCVISDGRFGAVTSITPRVAVVPVLGDLSGTDGYSPTVTITEITGGHRITITDEAHPDGQSFDVMDGQGGSGSDAFVVTYTIGQTSSCDKTYAEIMAAWQAGKTVIARGAGGTVGQTANVYAIQNISMVAILTLTAETVIRITHTSADTITWELLGIDATDIQGLDQYINDKGYYAKPAGGIPKTDLAAAVQTSLGKADDALPASGDAYRTASIPMGQLDSTSTATVMTATIPGITELRDGVCVWLENGVIASASGVTLNINSLGAKPIYNSLSGAIVTTTFTVASTYLFVYNSTRVTGGCWDMVYGYDANTTYTPVKLGFGYATCSTAEATASKTAALSSYTLTTGGIVAVKFTNAVPAGATLNINSKGAKAIYYKGAAITAGVIKAGDTVTMIYSTYYHVLSIDRTPQPSDANPTSVNTYISAGISTDYARADHVHNFDYGLFPEELASHHAVNTAVILTDATTGAVLIQRSPDALAGAFASQLKVNFALIIPPDTTNYPVLFTASKFSSAGELHLTGIVDGVLYEAVLTPGADPYGGTDPVMIGTLTTTNLVLPSAQGVSF